MPEAARVHGGPRDAELRALGLDGSELLDFSVNVNPYGPCARVVRAVRRAALDRYPDATARVAREHLARTLAVDADALALGNGAAELLWTLARVLLSRGDRALIVEPTFCEFRAAAAAVGAHVEEYRTTADSGFRVDVRAASELTRHRQCGVAYVCAPNSPTGVGVPAVQIAAWAEAQPRLQIVLDQSFLSLSDDFRDGAVPMPQNVIRVRSLTKDHAIPGVRVGYLIAPPELVERLEEQRPAWSTSALAQAAVTAACMEEQFVHDSRQQLRQARRRLVSGLAALGLAPLPSVAPFVLVPVKDARGLRARLLTQHHVLVRDGSSFGLQHFIRVAVRPRPDCERLLAALERELPRC